MVSKEANLSRYIVIVQAIITLSRKRERVGQSVLLRLCAMMNTL
jgi:hypothetical protein